MYFHVLCTQHWNSILLTTSLLLHVENISIAMNVHIHIIGMSLHSYMSLILLSGINICGFM
jgi:hypothetical protein